MSCFLYAHELWSPELSRSFHSRRQISKGTGRRKHSCRAEVAYQRSTACRYENIVLMTVRWLLHRNV